MLARWATRWAKHKWASHPIRQYSQQLGNGGRGVRPSTAVASAALFSFAAYGLGSFYPPTLVEMISARPAPPPPEQDSAASLTYTENLETTLQNLPFLQALRKRPNAEEWYETRPYTRFPPDRRANSLTAGALRGAGRLALSPLVRAKNDESESLVIIHVGRGLCGHDGIVHGGMLATILDETMGRTAILNLPSTVGVTATMTVNYRAPTKADQFLVVKTKLESLNGRKAVVTGRIETLDGTLMVDGSALFVEPKYAKLLNSSAVKVALGAPEKSAITADTK